MQSQTLAGRALRAPDHTKLANAPRRRRSPRTPSVPAASLNAFVGPSAFDSGSTAALMTQVATGAAWVAAAWMGVQVVMQKASRNDREGTVTCETCHGSGVVDCLVCTRWSDATSDSSGCGCCAGSRKMACSSCSGGGTAVPIEAKVYIKREADYDSPSSRY